MTRMFFQMVSVMCLAVGLIATPPLFDRARAEAAALENRRPPAKVRVAQVMSAHDAELLELAAREASAKELREFRGGEPVIIISTTTLLIALVVVLLVLLLT